MKEAEFEAPGVLAVDAVLGRHLEGQRGAAGLQLGGGPGLLLLSAGVRPPEALAVSGYTLG